MTRIQVIGAGGMLGQAVCRAIQASGHELVILPIDIRRVVDTDIHAPLVINCAGLVKQRQVPLMEMVEVNQLGPHRLAACCDVVGARLIHVSTDCVFQAPGPHAENGCPDADDPYAQTKRRGEVVTDQHLTVRTSFIGWSERGLLHDLATLPCVRASRNLLWSGHTVGTIADVLLVLAFDTRLTGLLHIPGQFQNRWTLAQTLCHRYELGTAIVDDPTFSADRRLISLRWARLGLPHLPPFATQLERLERPV